MRVAPACQPEPHRTRSDAPGPTSRGLEHEIRALADKIDCPVWRATVRTAFEERGLEKFQDYLKERYLLDCTVWGVSAALFATIGVSFLLLGPTNYRSEDEDAAWREPLTYVYVASCVFCILCNANAVMLASGTYALSSVMPETRFLEWLVKKGQNGFLNTKNVSAWVQVGMAGLIACMTLSTLLMHGWPMAILTGGLSVLLYCFLNGVVLAGKFVVFHAMMVAPPVLPPLKDLKAEGGGSSTAEQQPTSKGFLVP